MAAGSRPGSASDRSSWARPRSWSRARKEAALGLAAEVDALIGDGLTPVLVAVDGRVVAAAGFGDPLRGDARAALARVRGLGWHLGILSGDHARVVAAVGRRARSRARLCRGGVTPEDKLGRRRRGSDRGPGRHGRRRRQRRRGARRRHRRHRRARRRGGGARRRRRLRHAAGRDAHRRAARRRAPDHARRPAQPGLLARLQRDRRRPGHERRAEPARGRDPDAAVLAHRHRQLVPRADVSDAGDGEAPSCR